MRTSFFHIVYGMILAGALMLLVSCADEELLKGSGERPDGETMLAVSFKTPEVRNTGNGGLYEEGVDFENYIDLDNNNFRIYFFDGGDNKFITKFVPKTKNLVGGSEHRITGVVPEKITRYSHLKVVVLANWRDYGDRQIIPGITTIDDICNAAWSKFGIMEDFELGPDKKRLIPFYGVHEYRNVTFSKGKLTTLDTPVALLRAMAKVEVILNMPKEADEASVDICGYNAEGFCAPEGVYTHSDYDHGGNWDEDYVNSPHLTNNGSNDTGATDRRKPFRQVFKGVGIQQWVVYIPEYLNIKGKDESYIEVRFGTGESYQIYFAKYKNGQIDGDERMNILRNNLYRYTGELKEDNSIVFSVTVDEFRVLPDEEIEWKKE